MPRTLGIDITEGAVRAVLVRTGFGRVAVERYLSARVPLGLDPEAERMAQTAAVEDVLSQLQRPADEVVAHLHGQDAALRTLKLPKGVKKRLDAVLPSQIDGDVPFELDEALVDYQFIAEGAELELLVCAVKRVRIGARIAELDAIGLDCQSLAVGAPALDGLAAFLTDPAPVAGEPDDESEGEPTASSAPTTLVLSLDRQTTDLCLLRDGVTAAARTLTGGLAQVESGARAALEGSLKRALLQFRADGHESPSRVIVTGEGVALDGAVQWVGQTLGVEAEPLVLPGIGDDSEDGPATHGRAAALAARGAAKGRRLELRQGEFAAAVQGHGLRPRMSRVALALFVILLSFGFSVGARRYVLVSERTELQEQLAASTDRLLGRELRSAGEARRRMAAIGRAEDPLPRYDAFAALDDLNTLITREIPHTTRRLTIDIDDEAQNGEVEIQGTVDTVQQYDALVAALREGACFREIDPGRTRPGPGGEKINYELKLTIDCAAPADGAGEEEEES